MHELAAITTGETGSTIDNIWSTFTSGNNPLTGSDWASALQNIFTGSGGGSSVATGGSKNFQGIVNLIISSILNPVVALLIGLAVIYFMWGVLKYVNRGQDDGAEGVKMMTYGIFALFVMVSVWGLVYILINTFNLNSSSVPALPALQ